MWAPVRAASCCGLGRVAVRPRGVAGRDRVVREHRGLARVEGLQRVEHAHVQGGRAARGDGALHGLTGELVPEHQAAARPGQQPGVVEPAQGRQVDAEGGEEPVVDPVRGAGDQLEDLEVLGATSRVLARTASRTDAGRGRSGSFATSTTKKGLPFVRSCTASASSAVPSSEVLHGVDRQRCEREGDGRLGAGDLAEQGTRRVPRADLHVAVGEHERERQ